MRRVLFSTTIAFLLGLAVGGIAFGQRDDPPPGPVPPGDVAQPVPAEPPVPVPSPPTSPAAEGPGAGAAADADQVDETAEGLIGPIAVPGRLQRLESRWADLTARIDRLSRRVVDLERQASGSAEDPTGEGEALELPPLPIATPEDRRSALVIVGVDRHIADEIVWRESTLAMARLDLQDRAAREGWAGTERYFEEIGALNEEAVDLRTEVGDLAYDRFLYETGQPNRVAVNSVIPGSQGEQVGLLPGDIVEDYAGNRVFDFSDLRSATTSGARDELVPVTIRRDGRLLETWMARGPIGVSLEADSVSPDL